MLISVDPAKSAGIVFWQHGVPERISTLEPLTKKKDKKAYEEATGLSAKGIGWALRRWDRTDPARRLDGFGTQGDAFAYFLCWAKRKSVDGHAPLTVVMEEGFGASTTTVKQHAFLRGYIARICDELKVPWYEVNVSEWRRVVGARHGITFPNNSELAKARAAEIAATLVPEGFEFHSTDETDALMVGLWAIYTGTAK